jgi:hypothetical protein
MNFRKSIDLIENVISTQESTAQLKQFAKIPEVVKLFKDVEKHPAVVKQLSKMLITGLGVKKEEALVKAFFKEVDRDPKFAEEIKSVLSQYPTVKDLFKALSGHVVDAHFAEEDTVKESEELEEMNRLRYVDQYASISTRDSLRATSAAQSEAKAKKFNRVLLIAAVLGALSIGGAVTAEYDIIDKLEGLKKDKPELDFGGGLSVNGVITKKFADKLDAKSDSEIRDYIKTPEGSQIFNNWLNKQMTYSDNNLELIDGSNEDHIKEFIKQIRNK